MDKKAFKQRMQSLKAYRESNPGKTYLDWKVSAFADGGEIPPTNRPEPIERIPYKGKLYTDKYGQKYTEEQYYDYINNSTDEISKFDNRPMVKGLKPITDLEDVANFTPIGDVIAVNDTYQAIKNDDWLGAGLAALTMIPFVPTTVKNFRKKYKGVTPKTKVSNYNFDMTVRPNYVQNRIDEAINYDNVQLAKRTKAVNQSYNIAERLMDDPNYMIRAKEVKKAFGDDYITPYADIIDSYNVDPTKLPKVQLMDLGNGTSGSMRNANGTYSYRIDPNMTNLDEFLTEHEYGHYVDFLRNKNRPSAEGDSNMFYQMSKDFSSKPIDSKGYYLKPSEQKSHMNQLREYMFQNGLINNRGQKVSEQELKEVLQKVSDISSLRGVSKASKQFKNLKQYTKRFNTVPLLGVGAMGVNQYFNNNE